MKLFPGLAGIAASLIFVARATAAALPYPDGLLLPNEQHRPVPVSVSGSHAAIITPEGIPRMFEKDPGGTWNELVDLPKGATSISILDAATPYIAVGYKGRIDLRFFNASEGSWSLIETIVLAAGETPTRMVLQTGVLAAIVAGGTPDEPITARIFEDEVADWNQTKVIEMVPPPGGGGLDPLSSVQSLDLSGTRLAIGSSGLGEVWIHEQNNGGPSNWGRVAVIPKPATQKLFGTSLALEGDLLAVASVTTADNKPEATAFSRNTGGTNAWGSTGTILDSAAVYGPASLLLDMTEGRLVALAMPNFSDILSGTAGSHAWFYSSGAGPGGWVEEAQKDLGRILSFSGASTPLSLHGNECFIGLTDEENLDGHGSSWATCVHRRGSGQWNQVQKLEGPGGPQQLGKVIAMRGNYLVAGMPGDDGTGADSGAVMIWTVISLPTDGDHWFPVGRLQSPTPAAGQRFGASVAISIADNDDYWVVVGAPGTNSNRGAIYIFNISSGGSNPTMLLKTPSVALNPGDEFGASVGLSEPSESSGPLLLAVGAPGKDDATTDSGIAYLFRQDLGGANLWGQWKTIGRPLIPGGPFFGDHVTPNGTTNLIVSQRPVGGAPGRIYYFSRNQGGSENWGLVTTISAPPGAPNRFAETISASRFGILVGAPGGGSGRGYYYTDPTAGPIMTFGDVTSGPEFGAAISISDDGLILIGDPGANSGAGRMSAWILTDFDPITWSPFFKRDGEFGSGMGSAVASSLLYDAGGCPFSDTVGSDYGSIDVVRAGSYEMWAANQGAGFTDWFPEQDADHDGQTNLVEFALGSNPRSATRGIFTMNRSTYPESPGPYKAMRFVRPSLPYSVSALHYRMERSDTLTSWLSARYDVLFDDPQARYYPATTPRAFFRLTPKYPDFTPETEGGILTPAE